MHTVLFASGNNMQFQGDMARRVVPIDLEPQTEHPEEREGFTHSPLLPWIARQRPKLVVAALTIVAGYFEAGCPAQAIKPMGSFEAWSTLIRQALIWAGEADPCAGRAGLEAQSDPDYEALQAVLAAWHARYGETPKTVAEVKNDLVNHTVYTDGHWITDLAWRELHSALTSLDRRGELNTRVIGQALHKWRGRVLGDKRLALGGEDTHAKTKKWRVLRH